MTDPVVRRVVPANSAAAESTSLEGRSTGVTVIESGDLERRRAVDRTVGSLASVDGALSRYRSFAAPRFLRFKVGKAGMTRLE